MLVSVGVFFYRYEISIHELWDLYNGMLIFAIVQVRWYSISSATKKEKTCKSGINRDVCVCVYCVCGCGCPMYLLLVHAGIGFLFILLAFMCL